MKNLLRRRQVRLRRKINIRNRCFRLSSIFRCGTSSSFCSRRWRSTLAGIFAVRNIPLDAIPDLSDTQVIIYTEWQGQAPQIVQDQVTYPITTKMLSVPRAKVVRGYSFYGFSFVYVIFEDGTDPYWARSRVLEYLSSLGGNLPKKCDAGARARRDRCRLGVHVFAKFEGAQSGRAAVDARLVSEISAHVR